MSALADLFDENLILFDVDADSRQVLFEKVAKVLDDEGYVRDTYSTALNKREDEFPTGVVTQYLPIALPHADPVNVKQPFVAVVQTKNKIHVKQMGLDDDEETQVFFFLGIVKETQNDQVKLLQRFMQLMNDEQFVKQFQSIKSAEEMYKFFSRNF